MIGPSAPVSDVDRFAQTIAGYERRIADLERAFARYRGGAGAPAGTGVDGQEYWDTTNKRLYRSDGTGWIIMAEPDQTYAPTVANISSASTTGRFHRSDGFCDFAAEVTLTGAGVVTGQPTVLLPKAFAAHSRGAFGVALFDANGLGYVGGHEILAAGATVISPLCVDSGGANAWFNNVLVGTPFTWVAPDRIAITGRGKMNTRYL